jgi:hypothetical protein
MAALRTRSNLAAPRSVAAKSGRRFGVRRALWLRLGGGRLRTSMLRRITRVRASGTDLLETSSVAGKRRFKLRRFLPPLDGDIDISRLIFDAKSDAPHFFGRQNGRARTYELIEHSVAARRRIEQRVAACGAAR